MKVRLLVIAGVLLLSAFFVAGRGPDSGGADVDEPSTAPDASADTDGPDTADDEDALLIADDGVEVHQDCEYREVVVTADDAVVVLDGACALVRATGRGSTVDVGSAERIVLVGVDNAVSFAAGDPEVVNRGRGTTVAEGGVASE